MKTTIELPDQLFRRAKASAAERGQLLREFLADAVREKLQQQGGTTKRRDPEILKGLGGLKHLRRESARIRKVIEQEFEVIESEDRL
ncbi:MAG: hypothetical protein FJX59_20360 [Alphaproteobacteria bacterium]|nr:hypothetical protein [Alphaproteobacteria bacterium]